MLHFSQSDALIHASGTGGTGPSGLFPYSRARGDEQGNPGSTGSKWIRRVWFAPESRHQRWCRPTLRLSSGSCPGPSRRPVPTAITGLQLRSSARGRARSRPSWSPRAMTESAGSEAALSMLLASAAVPRELPAATRWRLHHGQPRLRGAAHGCRRDGAHTARSSRQDSLPGRCSRRSRPVAACPRTRTWRSWSSSGW